MSDMKNPRDKNRQSTKGTENLQKRQQGQGRTAPNGTPQPQRFEMPDGSFGIYMGETGKDKGPIKRSPAPPRRNTGNSFHSGGFPESREALQRAQRSRRYALSEEERREIERRHSYDRERRRAAAEGRMNRRQKGEDTEPSFSKGILKYISYYAHSIWDRIYMGWMGISIDLDTIVKSLIIAGMVLLFAMLQTTVFSRFALFGAKPDLMLALVIAVGTTEGERWGGATGLAAAFLIEALGGTGLTLLPLLYVPVGFAAGVLCTNYLRDTVLIRIIYTGAAGILRALFTTIYVVAAYKKVDAGLLFTGILIPEYFSTAVMSILPHVTEWFALKAFHKSREDRISS